MLGRTNNSDDGHDITFNPLDDAVGKTSWKDPAHRATTIANSGKQWLFSHIFNSISHGPYEFCA
jgi:hypothetical protein